MNGKNWMNKKKIQHPGNVTISMNEHAMEAAVGAMLAEEEVSRVIAAFYA